MKRLEGVFGKCRWDVSTLRDVTKELIYRTVHSRILPLSSRAVFFFLNSFQKPSSPPPGVKCAMCYSWQLCLTCELLSSLRSTNIIANCSPALQLLLLLCLLIIILAVALSLRNGNDAKGRSPLIIIQHWFVKTGSRSHQLGWRPIYTIYVYTL